MLHLLSSNLSLLYYRINPIITRYDQKLAGIFKFRGLRTVDFRIFFCYVRTHVCYIYSYMLTLSAILDCQFVFDR